MKKKELLIISSLILLILGVIFIPKLISCSNNKHQNETNNNDNDLIKIIIEGEINYPSFNDNEYYQNYMEIEELKGVTYKEIYKRIYNFRTK